MQLLSRGGSGTVQASSDETKRRTVRRACPCQPILLVFSREVLAQVPQTAFCAVRLARITHGAAVQHDAMAEVGRVLRRKYLPQLHLNLDRILQVIHKPQPVRDTDAVRIDDRGAGHLEHIAENQICRFPAQV